MSSNLSSTLLYFHLYLHQSLITLNQSHFCLSHASSDKLRNLVSTGTLNNVSKFSHFDCLNCKLVKQPALFFTTSVSLCDTSFDLINSDILGLDLCTTFNGCRYFVLIIDDYSRFTWIYFLKHRSSLYQIYIDFANMVYT